MLFSSIVFPVHHRERSVMIFIQGSKSGNNHVMNSPDRKNNILNLVKKSTLLLSLAPCMLVAKNKLEDPTNIPPTTDDHITDTRTHAPTSLAERLLAIDSLTENDFVEILVESQGSFAHFNPNAKKFQVTNLNLSADK